MRHLTRTRSAQQRARQSAIECLTYALSLPTSVVITGCDSLKVLEQALHVARTFQPLTAATRTSFLAKTEASARDRRFELYKISRHLRYGAAS
jgi:hypothetical protein